MNVYSSAAIGKRLDSGITDKGITYEELGSAVSVSEDVVKNWVSGRTKIPIDRLAVRGEWNDQNLMVV